MIYCFYLFNRDGVCLYYEDWHRTKKPKSLPEEHKVALFSLQPPALRVGANQEDWKRQCAPILRAGGRVGEVRERHSCCGLRAKAYFILYPCRTRQLRSGNEPGLTHDETK